MHLFACVGRLSRALWPCYRCHLDLLLWTDTLRGRYSPSIVWLCREIKISRGIQNTSKSTSEDYAHSVRHGKQVVDFLGKKSSAKGLRLAGNNNNSKNATSFIIDTMLWDAVFTMPMRYNITGVNSKKVP